MGDYWGGIGAKLSSGLQNMRGKKHDSSRRAADLAAGIQQNEEKQYEQNKDYTKQLGTNDQKYLGTMQGNVNKYQGDLDQLTSEVGASQKNAQNTYSNDIQPRMKDLMESAHRNASSAMSLQDAMDPNNSVAAGTRSLYDAQGQRQRDAYNAEAANTRDVYNQQGSGVQKQYEQEAQNEGRQGLADTGILGALGMQNMAGQLGNVPMTGGQLQALMGANQAQTGAAYSKTLQRGQSLRDQGLQGNIDLQTKGLDSATLQRDRGLGRQSDLGAEGLQQGFARSDMAYNQGQQAQDRYGRTVGNYEAASDRQLGRDQGFRGERNGLSGQGYGLQQQMADATRGAGASDIQRQMSNYNTHMGGNQANLGAQIQGINADKSRDAAMQTGALQTAGTVAGAYFGGPAGAAAGGQAGKMMGDANAPSPSAVPSYGNYGSASAANPNPSMQQQNMGIQQYMNANEPAPNSYAGPDAGGMQGLGLMDEPLPRRSLQARMARG